MNDKPISWLQLDKGFSVVGTDGEEIGEISDVVADVQQGIFSGVAVSSGFFSDKRFVPADLIDTMTESEIRLALPAAEADAKLEPYS